MTRVASLPDEQLPDLLELLFDSARRDEAADHAIQSAITIVEQTPSATDSIVGSIRELRAKLTAGHGLSLADSPLRALKDLAAELKDDPNTSKWAREAITAVLA